MGAFAVAAAVHIRTQIGKCIVNPLERYDIIAHKVQHREPRRISDISRRTGFEQLGQARGVPAAGNAAADFPHLRRKRGIQRVHQAGFPHARRAGKRAYVPFQPAPQRVHALPRRGGGDDHLAARLCIHAPEQLGSRAIGFGVVLGDGDAAVRAVERGERGLFVDVVQRRGRRRRRNGNDQQIDVADRRTDEVVPARQDCGDKAGAVAVVLAADKVAGLDPLPAVPQPGGRAAAEQRAVRRFHGEQAGVVLSHSSVKKRHNASYSSESPDDSSDGSEEVDGSPEGSSGSSSESTISMGVPGSTSVFGSRLWSMTVPLL